MLVTTDGTHAEAWPISARLDATEHTHAA
jgi:hypothetical protein